MYIAVETVEPFYRDLIREIVKKFDNIFKNNFVDSVQYSSQRVLDLINSEQENYNFLNHNPHLLAGYALGESRFCVY